MQTVYKQAVGHKHLLNNNKKYALHMPCGKREIPVMRRVGMYTLHFT